MEERTPSSATAICTYTHFVQVRKVQALYSTACQKGGQMGETSGQQGSCTAHWLINFGHDESLWFPVPCLVSGIFLEDQLDCAIAAYTNIG